jgi:hypothetical protein
MTAKKLCIENELLKYGIEIVYYILKIWLDNGEMPLCPEIA